MIGARVLPPAAGSPCRRRCSSTSRDRRRGSRRGRHARGSTSSSTWPRGNTPRRPNPRKRQSLRTRGSASRPRPREETRTASQTSSQAAVRSTPCSTSQGETGFKLADHYHGRIVAAERHKVAAVDLALDLEAEPLEEALYGQIERRLQSDPRAASARNLRAVQSHPYPICATICSLLSEESEGECDTSAMLPRKTWFRLETPAEAAAEALASSRRREAFLPRDGESDSKLSASLQDLYRAGDRPQGISSARCPLPDLAGLRGHGPRHGHAASGRETGLGLQDDHRGSR